MSALIFLCCLIMQSKKCLPKRGSVPIIQKGYGIIIRTSAEGKNETEIKEDLDKLIKKWQNILEKYNNFKKQKTFIPKIIYKNQGIIEKLILDLVDKELTRIIANDETTYAVETKFSTLYFTSSFPFSW